MSNADVTQKHFELMWSEISSLVNAWQDRHDLDGRGAAGILVQYGTTLAHNDGTRLDEVLDLVQGLWARLEEQK